MREETHRQTEQDRETNTQERPRWIGVTDTWQNREDTGKGGEQRIKSDSNRGTMQHYE